MNVAGLSLCAFSKSEVLDDCVLPDCPMGLRESEHRKCPCRKRLHHVTEYDLRVLSCTYPEAYDGRPIHDEPALIASLTKNRKQKKAKEPMATATEEKPAGTAGANADGAAKLQQMARKVTNALAVYKRVPNVAEFVRGFGGVLGTGKLMGCQTEQQGQVVALTLLTEGISPMAFIRKYHIIEGKPQMRTDAALADFKVLYGGRYRVIKRTPEIAQIELSQGKGKNEDKQVFTFTMEDAIEEDYVFTKEANKGDCKKFLDDQKTKVNPFALKTNWKTARRRMQMLWWRVVSDALHVVCPEISAGSYCPDEFDATDEVVVPDGEIGAARAADEADDVVDGDFTVVHINPEGEVASVVTNNGDAHQSVEQPPFTPSASPTTTNVTAPDRAGLMKQLKALKDQTLTQEQYVKVLDNKGVKSAKDLPTEVLEKLVAGLIVRAQKLDSAKQLNERFGGEPINGTATATDAQKKTEQFRPKGFD